MKIAIVVQGRFDAFDLAKALLKRGHEVTVFTNYPVWAVRSFGLPAEAVRSFWLHGVLFRLLYKFSNAGLRWDTSGFLSPLFGRWAATQVRKKTFDIVHCFTGVATELLASQPGGPKRTLNLIVRGSSHIVTQDALLRDEELRSKRRIERPSKIIIGRELEEYRLADGIVTLSTFAYNSFISQGISGAKLLLMPLGVNVDEFRAAQEVLEARCRRITTGAPLRVLWVGTMSLRKGMLDYIEIVKALRGGNFQFRFVGDIPADLRSLAAGISDTVELIPRQAQRNLREYYGWGDVFIFPTIEDGFAVVLAQANANGLPILTTTNCAGPDLIRESSAGWVLPIRDPQAFVERLRWCDRNRESLSTMATRIGKEFVPRTWDDTALQFERLCLDTLRTFESEGVSH